ncbi:MAG: BamA/TamA family outer membrane protein, partial [bacterium]|nr:BamA/TamA family outer membrane protein [bacterium]
TRIQEFKVTGNRAVGTDVLKNILGVKPGTLLVERQVAAGLEALVGFYETQGYPFCALYPDLDIQAGADFARISVRIEEGPFVQIDTVHFEGNQVTRAEVLLREMRIGFGVPYDQRKVDRGIQRLLGLSFLEAVGEGELRREGGRIVLVVPIRESRSARFEGGVGYAPGQGGVGQGITGRFALDFDNFLGSGRQGQARWIRRGSAASDLSLQYKEPWMMGFPVFSEFRLNFQQRPGYTENGFGGTVGMDVTSELEIRLGGVFRGVRPDSSGFRHFFRHRMWGVEGGVRYDTRDDFWNPRSGSVYRGNVIVGKVFQGQNHRSRRQYDFNMAHFVPVGSRSLVALDFYASRVTQTGGVFPEALLRLGGIQTLRGYREEHFWASKAAWANLEWRFLLNHRSRAFLFLDLGFLDDPLGGGSALWPVGYGAGLRMVSRLGRLGLDYGLARGDHPGLGKVHLQMVNEF